MHWKIIFFVALTRAPVNGSNMWRQQPPKEACEENVSKTLVGHSIPEMHHSNTAQRPRNSSCFINRLFTMQN
jgi:hypothetical protein